jgi:phosphoserine phosphatase
MTAPRSTLLVTLSGPDRPGVTAGLFAALSEFPVEVSDIEQIVARNHLTLAVLLSLAPEHLEAVDAAITAAASTLGFEVTMVPGAPETQVARGQRLTVTVLGRPLRPEAVRHVASEVARFGCNIDRIRRLADYPVTAIVLEGSGPDVVGLRRALAEGAPALGVDISVQDGGPHRRGQLLVVMDVDSTLIQDEVIDLLARRAGTDTVVGRITEAAMRGEIDFEESLRQRVATLAGLPESVFDEVRAEVRLTPGARTLVRTLRGFGFKVCLVSGGFDRVVAPIAEELGIDAVRANQLEVLDGRLTGRVLGRVVDRRGKREALEEFAAEFGIPMSRTVAIGDGANDLDMLDAAGLGVAFNAKPAVRSAADTSVSVPYLDSVLYLLGITRDDVEALV